MTEILVASSTTRKVLVIDDEHVIADTLAIILTNAGFEVRSAYSGEQAVELLQRFRPDILIADVIMFGMSGIEFSVIVRNRFPMCKVLLFSGQAATADLLEQSRAQGYEFEILAKPVHPTDLLERSHKAASVALWSQTKTGSSTSNFRRSGLSSPSRSNTETRIADAAAALLLASLCARRQRQLPPPVSRPVARLKV